jgi:hypothetical protein
MTPDPQDPVHGRPYLDMTQDPDRFDPARDGVAEVPSGPLDRSLDPDRFDPARDDRTLPELLGAGAFEEPRDTSQWLVGLLGVLAFLALVSWLFGSVLSG